MDSETVLSAIRELEKLENEQETELNQTRDMILTLKKRIGFKGESRPSIRPPFRVPHGIKMAEIDPMEKTYGELCLHILQLSRSSMHISAIIPKLEKMKNLESGSLTLPSIYTCLKRLEDQTGGLVRKVAPGTFKYFGNGNE